MYQMVIEYFGDRRVPVALVVISLVVLAGAHEWADMHYMPFSLAQAGDTKLEKKIDAVDKLVKNHISVYDINENKKAIKVNQKQQFDLKQFERVNGANEMTIKRAEELRQELIDLNDIKACLLNGNTNCQ